MDAEKMEVISCLRELNYPYSFIANELKMSINTVKSICRRAGIRPRVHQRKTKEEKKTANICKCCHKPLPDSKRKDSQFCSGYCRTKWRRQNIKVTEKKT